MKPLKSGINNTLLKQIYWKGGAATPVLNIKLNTFQAHVHAYVYERMHTFLLKGTRSHVNLMFVLKSQTDDCVNLWVIMIAKACV